MIHDQSAASHNWGWFFLRGVLAFLLALAAIFFPLSALFGFTMVFAIYAFIDGVAALVSGLRGSRKGERWGALLFQGVVGILVGLFFLFMPLAATVTYAFVSVVMLACWALVSGVAEIAAAFRLRKEIRGEWLFGLSGLFSVLLGIAVATITLASPAATILSAAWLIAIYAFASTAVLIAQAIRLRSRSRPAGSSAWPQTA